ncbi:hypothetical protein IQ06DRAFT_368993 [Phaeosphaeriaceae sp. SRC1lsM3a]|nr:hypothetical protein IQ06DRAFT_368993 [Stagonospora sp. SRC1lsM3a]
MARDGRKRGYSQAFQLMMNAVPNRRAQIPRTMTASALSEASTPLEFAWCNKENEKPFDNDMYSPFLDSPATPPPSFCWPADLKPFPLPPPQVKVQPDEPRPLQTLIQIPYKNTPSSKLSSSPIGRSSFRPALALGSSPSDKGSILDMPSTGPGPTIFEDNIAMSGSSWFGLPLTPSELPMQDLSLGSDPVCPLPALPTLRKIPRDRTTVHIGSVSDWYTCFPNNPILDTDIMIVFDKSRDAVKMNVHTLCAASTFFATIFSVPWVPEFGQVRILRLRDDFPYAILALLDFISTGAYSMHDTMRTRFPTTNVLDLHIHAYLAGSRYGMPQLASHALMQYIALGKMCLRMPFDLLLPSNGTNDEDLMQLDSLFPPPHAGNAIVRAWLESVAMLWNKTVDRDDEMRRDVLEVVKHYLSKLVKVPLFGMLMREVEGFARDVEESLLEDGVEMRTYWVPVVQGRGRVTFG